MEVIGCKCVLKTKLKAYSSLNRLKACLVVNCFHQTDGVDYTETISPVIKPSTIRIVLSLAMVYRWDIRQLNVKNAFLHNDLQEVVFMDHLPGFIHPTLSTHVCKLNKILYGLKQAPRA